MKTYCSRGHESVGGVNECVWCGSTMFIEDYDEFAPLVGHEVFLHDFGPTCQNVMVEVHDIRVLPVESWRVLR